MRIGSMDLMTIDAIYSALPHLPALGEEVCSRSFRMTLGGGPIASLVTAGRLGAQTRLCTCIGDDAGSAMGAGILRGEGVECLHFDCDARGGSPVYYTSVMTFAGSDRAFVSYFPDTDFFATRMREKAEALRDCDVCILSNRIPEEFESLPARIAFDVSWRDGMKLEDYLPWLRRAWLFTPNEKEARQLTGCADVESAALALARHVENVVVKLGAEGAMYVQNGRAHRVPGEKVAAVDSTGAGDAFLGGLVYGLASGWDMEEAVCLANYTGATATTAIGCLTARPSMALWRNRRNA